MPTLTALGADPKTGTTDPMNGPVGRCLPWTVPLKLLFAFGAAMDLHGKGSEITRRLPARLILTGVEESETVSLARRHFDASRLPLRHPGLPAHRSTTTRSDVLGATCLRGTNWSRLAAVYCDGRKSIAAIFATDHTDEDRNVQTEICDILTPRLSA